MPSASDRTVAPDDCRHRLRMLALAALLAVTDARSWAADVYVISNGEITMTAEEVKEVFLGESQFAGSLRLQPVDNAGAQVDFLSRVLNMAPPKYVATWTKKAFRDGLNAPPLKSTDVEVLTFVKSHPGAIGYMSSAPQGVHVVGKF